jgi:chromosome segregation ATPase
MSGNKARIDSIKKEIDHIKSGILMNKRSLDAKKSDVKKVNDRYKASISRAASKDKPTLRDRKAKEIKHLKQEMDSVKKQILDKKKQIERKREEIKKLKAK